MEFKHFSHNHGLVSHQMPQGSEFQCSGCKSPGSGNVFVCWQCTYFLHDQCYRAARSLKHPSHPLHPLTLVPFPTYPSGSFFCNSCNHSGDGFSYSCSECEFDVHVHCALMPNAHHNINPQTQNPIYPPPIQTNAHPPYPPHNPTISNDFHTYPPPPPPPPHHNPMIPNVVHIYPPLPQPHNPTIPIDGHIYPPPQNPTIPNDGHIYPPPPQPQNATYPPIPNNPYPNFAPPNPTIPNQPQDYTQTNTYPPNHNVTPIPNAYVPQPNQNFVNYPNTNPPPPQPAQPNPTAPTYSTVVNTTPTTTPDNNNPPISQPKPTQYPQTNNSEPKPPSMIKHFSHPHVLKPMDIDPKKAKVCSACECELSSSAYCCTEPHCTFNLHKTCFDSPRELRHKCHLDHPLTLLAKPPYDEGFTCNACLKDGKAFTYTCSTCSYDLHIDCVKWPDSVTRPDHKHALTLYYSSPASGAGQDVTFVCDACRNPVHELAWVYYCRECDFGTHLECVASGVKEQCGGGSSAEAQSEAELINEMELKFAVLHFLLQAQESQSALGQIG